MMDKLIQFVIQNFIFIVIILSVISSIFNKIKNEMNKTNRTPSFGGDSHTSGRSQSPMQEDTSQPIEYLPDLSPMETTATHEEISSMSPYDEETFENEVRDEDHSRTHQTTVQPISAAEVNDNTSPVYHPLVQGDLRRKAVEGMMWAEVFGKPRAYRHKHTR